MSVLACLEAFQPVSRVAAMNHVGGAWQQRFELHCY